MSDEKDLKEEIIEEEISEKNKEPAGETEDTKPKQDEKDEALETKYLRLMADFQNYKRRSEKEKADVYAYANEKIVVQLLDVIDNFERALDCTDTSEKGFAEGMKMIFKQLKDVLKNSNVEEIEALGLDFDPNFHNAVMMEDTDEYESGKVSAVLQKGYTLNGRVIRASMVKVAK